MNKAQALCINAVLFSFSFSTTRDQAELLVQMFPKDSKEYTLLLRYTQQKKTTIGHPQQSNGVGEAKVVPPAQPQDKRKARKCKKRRFSKLISCIRPLKEDNSCAARSHRQRAAADSCEYQNLTLQWRINAMTFNNINFYPVELKLCTKDVALVIRSWDSETC